MTPAPPNTSTWGYGMGVQLNYFSQDAKNQTVGLIQQAGFNWMKLQVQWYEHRDGARAVRLVAAGSDRRRREHRQLETAASASWMRRPSTPRRRSGRTPGDPNTFKTFMQTLGARYAGKVQAYEIWNEENLSREMGSGNVDPSHYLPLLMAGYTGMKAGDPNTLALLGAPSPTGANIPGESIDDLQYLQQLFALNGGQALGYFDAVSAHPSGFSNPPNCTPATPQCSLSGGFNNNDSFFAFTRVSQYHDLMVSQGIGNKKIWFTEFGYCSNSTPPPGYEYCTSIDATTQANFLVQAFQMARGLDYVAGMMQWNLNYQLAVPQTDEKWGFGIIRDDWSGRPAYSALAQMPKS